MFLLTFILYLYHTRCLEYFESKTISSIGIHSVEGSPSTMSTANSGGPVEPSLLPHLQMPCWI